MNQNIKEGRHSAKDNYLGEHFLSPHPSHEIARLYQMDSGLSKRYAAIGRLICRKDGQDLIEYSLLVALIASATTAGMSTVAKAISTIFLNIGTILSTHTG